jgi:hypothetical protein
VVQAAEKLAEQVPLGGGMAVPIIGELRHWLLKPGSRYEAMQAKNDPLIPVRTTQGSSHDRFSHRERLGPSRGGKYRGYSVPWPVADYDNCALGLDG